MARLLRCDGSQTVVLPLDGKEFTLQEIRSLIGGYMEVLPLTQGRYLVVDEEGKLKGRGLNQAATVLYQMDGMTRGRAGEQIVGDCLVCDPGEIS